MTPEQKAAYLKSPNHCLYCGSIHIEAQEGTFDDDGGRQPVTCLTCDKEWNDLYRLVDVMETI